jgi:hypothetical protein
MRVYLTTILTVVSLFLVRAIALGNSNENSENASAYTAAEIEVFRTWANSQGRLVNNFQSKLNPRTQQAIQEIEDLLKVRIQNHPDYHKYHWKILLFQNDIPNGFAYMVTPEMGEEHDWLAANGNKRWPIRTALGITDDKPIAFIGLTTEMLNKLKKKGHVAAVVGHEAKHIFDRHGVTGRGITAQAGKWINTQGKEVIADLGSLDFMLGHDRLEYALEVQDIFNHGSPPSNEIGKHLEQAVSSSAQVHHHPSVRQSILQARAAFLNRHDRRAVQDEGDDIPQLWKSVARKPLQSPMHAQNLIKRYTEAIDEMQSFPENADFLKYTKSLQNHLERETVEYLKDAPMVVSRFLDLVSLSPVSPHKKAMMTASFMVQQMEFAGWQEYFTNIPNGEALRWQRLLSSLSPQTMAMGVFDTGKDYIGRKNELLKMFERGAFADKIGNKIIAAKPVWMELFRGKFIDEFLLQLFPPNSRPYFNEIAATLGITRSDIISSRSTDLTHEGPVHHEIVNSIVEKLESMPFEDLLKQDESKYKASELDRFKDLIVWLRVFRKIYEPENQKRLKAAHLDQTVNRIWSTFGSNIKKKIYDQMKEIIASPDTNEYAYFMDQIGEGLAIFQSIDPGIVNDHEFKKSIVELVSKMTHGPAKSALSVVWFRIWNGIDEKLVLKLVLSILTDTSFSFESRFETVFGLAWGSGYAMEDLMENNPRIRAHMRLVLQNINAHQPQVIERLLFGKAWNKEFKAVALQKDVTRDAFVGMIVFRDYQVSLVQTIMASGLMPKLSDVVAEMLIKETRWSLEAHSKTGIDYINSEFRTPAKGTEILIDWVLSKAPKDNNPRHHLAWFAKYEEIILLAGKNFIFSGQQKSIAGAVINDGLKLFSNAQLRKALKRHSVRLALNEEQFAEKVFEYLNQVSPPAKGKDVLRTQLAEIQTDLKFDDLNTEVKSILHNKLAQHHELQPTELDSIFPDDSRNETQKYENKQGLVRGLSLMVSFLENRTPQEQMQAIEYLMGRKKNPPLVVNLIQRELNKTRTKVNVEDFLSVIRGRLAAATVLERTMAINTLLAGINSFLNAPNGHKDILEFITKKIPPAQAQIVKDLGGAVIKAEGRDASLFVSYVLAQKDNGQTNQELGIELLMKGILDFYGVPGWKLAQYLGFSGEFKQFEAALASYQDAAFPPEYLEILIYLRDGYAGKLDFTKIKILKILGTGSVNIAVEYLDLQDNQIKVINVPRKNIKSQTKRDFKRFRIFLDELLKLPGAEKYKFLAGLIGTIEKSVELEFDRPTVLQRQKDAVEIYNNKSKGWKIRTVQTYGAVDDIILLEKAYGVGATKIIKTDSALYKSAMGAVYDFEFKYLKGNLSEGIVNLANPDLHDGQVFIDEKSKTVTVIDFGQAVPIDAKQRSLGVDVLALIAGLISPESYQKKLASHRSTLGGSSSMSKEKLSELLAKPDVMDRFVHLIAIHAQAGIELPLSTVHWIFGMNRLRVLGKKIGLRPDVTMGALVYGKLLKDAVKTNWERVVPKGNSSCERFYNF